LRRQILRFFCQLRLLKLGLWPDLPKEATPEIYDTAGGPTRVYRVRNAVKVRSAEGVEAIADAVIISDRGGGSHKR
jgi:2-C-methyl-D-erythritol 4-phosphate cytidylyltransferase